MVEVNAFPPTTNTVFPYSLSLFTRGMKSLSPLTIAKAFTCVWVKAISSASSARLMSAPFLSPRGDKNGADINLALDALEMAFTHTHVNAFAIVSGDSDFIPLVNKLKEYGKTVFVVGGKAFTSTILQQNCHEFISFESLLSDLPASVQLPGEVRAPRPRGERPERA